MPKDKKKKARRYLGGLKATKYFAEVAWPENEEIFQILGFDNESGLKAFESFIEIDDDNSGEVSLEEFHQWLGFKITKFSERVFGIIDIDGSGFLDFREFVIGVWNFNTYDASLLAKLAYNIFDVDGEGVLDMAECEALVRMVYNVPAADPAILKKMDVNGDGHVTLEELEQLIEVHNYILQPAFDVQRALRQRVVGVRYWEQEMVRRRAYFSGYDAGAQASWDSIRAILEIKHKERLEQEGREREVLLLEERRLLEVDKLRALRMREELAQRRRRRAAERRAADETDERRAAKAALLSLNTAEEALKEELVAFDLPRRVAQRAEFWRAFDAKYETESAARRSEHARRLKLVEGSDAEARFEDELETLKGQKALHAEFLRAYAVDLVDSIQRQKRPGPIAKFLVNHLFAPVFGDDEDEDGYGQPTMVAEYCVKHLPFSKKRLSKAREQALASLLAERRSKSLEELLALVKEEERLAVETAKEDRELKFGDHGGPDSKWERLWDAHHGAAYWQNWGSQQSKWAKPDVCHVCDAAIDCDDALCFTCNTARSSYNHDLWQSRQYSEKVFRGHEDSDDDDEEDEAAALVITKVEAEESEEEEETTWGKRGMKTGIRDLVSHAFSKGERNVKQIDSQSIAQSLRTAKRGILSNANKIVKILPLGNDDDDDSYDNEDAAKQKRKAR